mmetsp:Transcript_7659/g.16036  ORF Transcript_7659/g.16036 Transcript_7659/m.16036 type:complete len:95 (+) Transcript_7659:386-670(+)
MARSALAVPTEAVEGRGEAANGATAGAGEAAAGAGEAAAGVTTGASEAIVKFTAGTFAGATVEVGAGDNADDVAGAQGATTAALSVDVRPPAGE